jgi:ABC-type phosphate transport system permease subunit
MFEHHRQPVLSRTAYLRRQIRFAALALSLVGGSLVIGVLGYHVFEGLDWLDALVNSSMILGGMGPVNELHTVAGKLFASFYALYSGMIFLIAIGVLSAPLLHRFLHTFHLELDADAPATGESAAGDDPSAP